MAEIVSREEYQRKERQQSYYQNQRYKYQCQVDSLDAQIKRLEKAVSVLRECNKSFRTESGKLSTFVNATKDLDDFKGDKNGQIIGREGKELGNEGQRCQRNEINRALDDMEWVLTKKKNERSKAYGLLGDAASALRSIGTWLRTHFN